MKLTTLNLQGFVDWQTRQPEITKYLKKNDSDIIFFQEVVYLPEISPYNRATLLNQTLGYEYEHSAITRLQTGTKGEPFREGLALLSKFPIIKTDTVILKQANGDEHNRILQLIDIKIDDRIIKFANVHFSLTDTIDYATAHLEETLEILSARNETRIIAGDFNMDHLESLSNLWNDKYNATTEVPYISYPSMNKRNDYILLPKEYSFGKLSVSGDDLSDHRAVTIEINLVSS